MLLDYDKLLNRRLPEVRQKLTAWVNDVFSEDLGPRTCGCLSAVDC